MFRVSLGFSGSGTNFYAYGENNPIDWNDPWGLRKCKGKARIMQGNRGLVGNGGAFDTGPSNLDKYAVTEDSAAVVPFQFGQTRDSMRRHIEEISGSVSGSYTVYQRVGKKKVEVPVSYQFDFNRVRDQVDDYDTRTENGLKTTSAYQKWLVKREKGLLIIELPGMSHDGGIGSVNINVPDSWQCPCGTTEVK